MPVKYLILDAGPLLSLSNLRGLAETYVTVPQVLDELKDKRAREHFDRLGLSAGVNILVQSPDSASLSHVMQFAKKTGDYAVLSHADLCVLALTYAFDSRETAVASTLVDATITGNVKSVSAQKKNAWTGQDSLGAEANEDKRTQSPASANNEDVPEVETLLLADLSIGDSTTKTTADMNESVNQVPLVESGSPPLPLLEHTAASTISADSTMQRESIELSPDKNSQSLSFEPESSNAQQDLPLSQANVISPPDEEPAFEHEPLYEDPSDDDDGEGEWITPSNAGLHQSRALDMLPLAENSKSKQRDEDIIVGCMTADFAMQNVLLQMGLSLVGTEGKRIRKVKTWVLRCHACFKICKDSAKKFCPSCGNPTLLRASVTLASPGSDPNAPAMQLHLKKNFQYKNRGTIFSIPAPKFGSAKKGTGEGLILREDQTEYFRAKKLAEGKRQREEQRTVKGIMAHGTDTGVRGSWMDPDWRPEIVTAGAGGKGRTLRNSAWDGDLPKIGSGRKNPNEVRKRK